MKKFWLMLPFALLALASCDQQVTHRLPSEGTIVRGEEDNPEKERREREEWMERMHRAAPGVNWKAIDEQTRWSRYLQAQGIPTSAGKTASDTVAGGIVIGTWKERGSVNQSGRIVYAELDTTNNSIYAAADGGQVFKGTAAGTGWTPLNDRLRMGGINTLRRVKLPAGGRRLLVCSSKRVWRTDDDGANWIYASGLDGVNGWGWTKRMIVQNDAEQTTFVLLYEWDYTNWNGITSLYRSTDQGASFSKIRSWAEPAHGGMENFDIWTDRYGSSTTTYLIKKDSVFTLAPVSSMPVFLATLPGTVTAGTTLLTGAEIGGKKYLYSYNRQDIFRSTNGGSTWTFQGNIGKWPFMSNSFSMSRSDTNLVYFGDVECWRSTDAGANWAKVNNWWAYYSDVPNKLHADIPAIIPMYDASGNEFQFICTDGGLYRSTDDVVTVNNLSMFGLNVSQYYTVYTNRTNHNYIYVGTQDQGFQRCQIDSGTVLGFNQLISGDYGHIVSSNGGQSLWCVYPGFADYYPNAMTGGSSASWDFNGTNPLWMPPLMAHPTDYWKAYMAGGHETGDSGSKIMAFTAIGGSVTVSSLPFDFEAASGGGFITDLDFSPLSTSRWYVVTDNGHFFYSTNSGSSWTESSGFTAPGAHYFYGAKILPSKAEPLTVYAAGSGYSNPGVWVSTDGGVTFNSASSGLPSTLVYDLDMNEDGSLLFAATEVGPYLYIRSTDTWYPMGDGSPDQTYWEVDYVAATQTVRFATYGRGIWDFQIDLFVKALEQNITDNSFELGPNPASEFTQIIWRKPLASVASYRLMDLKGQTLRTGTAGAGTQHASLPLAGLGQGVYLVQVQTGNETQVKKLLLAQ